MLGEHEDNKLLGRRYGPGHQFRHLHRGLVEVNEGSINLCKAASLGQQTQNYVGGIVGLNKPQGSIVKPELNGKTVTGKNMVGGIAADNYGTVTGVSADFEGKNRTSGHGLRLRRECGRYCRVFSQSHPG